MQFRKTILQVLSIWWLTNVLFSTIYRFPTSLFLTRQTTCSASSPAQSPGERPLRSSVFGLPTLCHTILLIFLFSLTAKSAHIIGGEMSYICNGNDSYTITIKMYRDCNGGGALFDSQPFAAIGQVTVYNGDAQFPFESVIFGCPPCHLLR